LHLKLIEFLEYIVNAVVSDCPAFSRPSLAKNEPAARAGEPLVSVIIPCYNGEAYLQEAIESALTQTHHPIEVLVIDDGSTDASSVIARNFPVRYIKQQNRGLTASRNRGILESRGSYIVFLDADDRLRPEAIETGLRALAENPECAMTVGDHHFVSEDGSHLANSRKECLQKSHYEALLKSNFIEMISSVLFRRSVLEQVAGFDTRLRVAEDYDLYLRIARDYSICCHSKVVADYRLHKSNVSRNSELMLTTTLRVLASQAGYARRDTRRLFAFLEGIRTWRKQYGRQLASELGRSYPTLHGKNLRRKLLLLLDYYPQGFMMVLALRFVPALDKRNTGSSTMKAAQRRPVSKRFQVWSNAQEPHSPKQFG
jgi:glycosyltransferase involved in cell wall biosynthesis